MKFRKTAIAAVAAGGLVAAAACSTAHSAAPANAGTEFLSGSTTGLASTPPHDSGPKDESQQLPLRATGLFADTGHLLLTSSGGPTGTDTLTFTRGTLRVFHADTGKGTQSVGQDCHATFAQPGTYKILSGTGAYAGATGHGTFAFAFTGTFPRLRGGVGCNDGPSVIPANPLTTFRATGTLTLPVMP